VTVLPRAITIRLPNKAKALPFHSVVPMKLAPVKLHSVTDTAFLSQLTALHFHETNDRP
jgi:hypothetical protein